MSKRKWMVGAGIHSKRHKPVAIIGGSRLSPEEQSITDTWSAIEYIRTIFPSKELAGRFPPIIFKQQLYALVKNRTDVDREVNTLAESFRIKVFHLGRGDDEVMILITEDFTSFVKKYHGVSNNSTDSNSKYIASPSKDTVISRFLSQVVSTESDISISESVLMKKYGFKDKDLTALVNYGLITLRDAGTWWFSVPAAGQFMKIFLKGKQAALRMIRMTRFKELHLTELKKRKVPPSMKLGILYHAYDLAGSDSIKCIESTSGTLLRIIND